MPDPTPMTSEPQATKRHPIAPRVSDETLSWFQSFTGLGSQAMPDPTPIPLSEDELKAIEANSDSFYFSTLHFVPGMPADEALGIACNDVERLVAEVRRLNAEVVSVPGERMTLTNALAIEDLTTQLGEANKRADKYRKDWQAAMLALESEKFERGKAEAAARELRDTLLCVGGNSLIQYQPMIQETLDSTAWLSTGGNDG